MKFSSLKRRMVMFIVNYIFQGTYFFDAKRKLLISIGYSIGNNTKIVGPLWNTGKLSIGENCWIGKNLVVHGNGTVCIGDNCDIAPEVVFLTGGHQVGTANRRAGVGERYHISVGNGTWIGARSTILGNTSIGHGCVITACACVTKSISDDVMVGGVPAKVIRELEDG